MKSNVRLRLKQRSVIPQHGRDKGGRRRENRCRPVESKSLLFCRGSGHVSSTVNDWQRRESKQVIFGHETSKIIKWHMQKYHLPSRYVSRLINGRNAWDDDMRFCQVKVPLLACKVSNLLPSRFTPSFPEPPTPCVRTYVCHRSWQELFVGGCRHMCAGSLCVCVCVCVLVRCGCQIYSFRILWTLSSLPEAISLEFWLLVWCDDRGGETCIRRDSSALYNTELLNTVPLTLPLFHHHRLVLSAQGF